MHEQMLNKGRDRVHKMPISRHGGAQINQLACEGRQPILEHYPSVESLMSSGSSTN